MPTIAQLDRYQMAVVESNAPSIRVVAPAGSGKTLTLAWRVQRRISQGINPQRILLLTFDNNAREAILQRLQDLLVPNGGQVSTLNAFGLRLLNSRFRDERTRIIREVYFPQSIVLSKLAEEYGHSVFTEMLAKIKNEAIDTRTIDQTELARWCSTNRENLLRNLEDDPILDDVSDNRFGHELAREMLQYEQFLEQRGGIDFDDQKLRPLVRLMNDSSALSWLQQQFDDVIVDEFQDINRLDAMLIDLIAGSSNLLVTGDDDQAIYGFRGATAGYLINPDRQFRREFQSYELAINYRCPPRILETAGSLINWNTDRIEKHPRAAKTSAGEIDTYHARDIETECDWLARRLKDLTAGDPRSAAVLARRRNQLIGIQAAFLRQSVPYKIDPGEDIRISWSLAARALKLTPLAIQGVPDTDTRTEIITIFAKARHMPMQRIDALLRHTRQDDLSFPSPEMLGQLFEREQRELVDGIKALVGEMPLLTRLRLLDPLLNTEIRTFMDGGKDVARDRSERDQSRLSGLIDLARAEALTAEALIARIESLLTPQRAAFGADAGLIELSTCHSAKGREWQIVGIPHCNQGVFPDSRSESGVHLEAERKLFYVSMTRASEHLIMSWSDDRGGGSSGEISTFLIEAEVAPKKRQKQRAGMATRLAREVDAMPRSAPSRRLVPDGSWAMTAPPRKISGPKPRYLTLVTPRGRSMQNALDIDASRVLADAIDLQHRERHISHDHMSIRFDQADGTATIALQLELALRNIPFAIARDDHWIESGLYAEITRAWAADDVANVSRDDAPLVDAVAAVLERSTGSDDGWVWLDRLQRLEEQHTGGDSAGIQFVPQ